MNVKIGKLIPIALIIFLGCEKNPTQNYWSHYRGYLSASDFKKTIIGTWISVWEHRGKENVEYLELNRKGNATIMIGKDGNRNNYRGRYRIDFPSPPREDLATLAELTIMTSQGNILLSRVHFGYHNMVGTDNVPFLRIDKEPFGVLRKIFH